MKDGHVLTLAVAGSRKTQGIVDSCAELPLDERVLVLTYTITNQNELRRRIAAQAGKHSGIEITGWFAFLITHFVRPFLPFAHPGKRVRGFDFESPPQQYSRVESYSRYFNDGDQVRRVHLAQIAVRIQGASGGEPITRLQRIYDRIYIDEVQDLCGYDLEVLALLLASSIPIEMVGDVRQAVIVTNERECKNKRFKYMGIWKWFLAQEKAGRLAICQRSETWRCHPSIAAFADSLFDSCWGFETTVSRNANITDHDGIFLIKEADLPEYIARYSPLFLRHSASSARGRPYAFLNIKVSKGLTSERVLVWPTGPIKKMLTKGVPLDAQAACELYVAVTRAEQSVGFVLDDPGESTLYYWTASDRSTK